ncbi:NYN domain-containing protein, partial [Nosocomiicoccus sp. HMSC059G07]
MLVDGYNLIGANKRLTEESRLSLEYAREELLTILSEYQAVSKYDVICVFDAY